MLTRYLTGEQMPEHTDPMSTTTGAARGNIFVDVDPEPTDARWRPERPKRAWRHALRRHGRGLVTPLRPAASSTQALRRGSRAPVSGGVRTGPFTSWHNTHGSRSSEHQPRRSGQMHRSAGRRRSPATRSGLVGATPILTAGLLLLAPFVYLTSRLVASPGVRISRPTRIMGTVTSPTRHRTSLRSTPRFSAPARSGRLSRERDPRHEVALHAASARGHAHQPAPRVPPAHAYAPRPDVPVPTTRELAPPLPPVPSHATGATSGAPTSAGTATNRSGPSGVAPFGPGYPESPNE